MDRATRRRILRTFSLQTGLTSLNDTKCFVDMQVKVFINPNSRDLRVVAYLIHTRLILFIAWLSSYL